MDLKRINEFKHYLSRMNPSKLAEIKEEFDDLENYIKEQGSLLEGESIIHEGGDESIYEGGIWYTELYEIQGWYFWREPEGEVYGLYSSLEEAQHAAWSL